MRALCPSILCSASLIASCFTGRAAAQPCVPGTSSPSGQAPCTPCNAGYFAPGSGAMTCLTCPAGTFSGAGSYSCAPCAAGYYGPYPGSSSCAPCPQGTRAPGPGSTGCETCPPGTFAPAASAACQPCSDGVPTISTQPVGGRYTLSSPITLNVQAGSPAGTGTITYYWRRDGVTLSDGPGVSGTHASTLLIDHAAGSNAGLYDAVATNGCGWVTSQGARVWICGSADFNHDGDIGTDADIESFFACLAGNCCAACGGADFNFDGDVGTDADIEAFFRVLAGGSC